MQRCGWLDTSRAATTTGTVQRSARSTGATSLVLPRPRLAASTPSTARASGGRGLPGASCSSTTSRRPAFLIAELRTGDSFSWGDPNFPYRASGSIGVDGIDDQAETATLLIAYQLSRRLPEASARPDPPGRPGRRRRALAPRQPVRADPAAVALAHARRGRRGAAEHRRDPGRAGAADRGPRRRLHAASRRGRGAPRAQLWAEARWPTTSATARYAASTRSGLER